MNAGIASERLDVNLPTPAAVDAIGANIGAAMAEADGAGGAGGAGGGGGAGAGAGAVAGAAGAGVEVVVNDKRLVIHGMTPLMLAILSRRLDQAQVSVLMG